MEAWSDEQLLEASLQLRGEVQAARSDKAKYVAFALVSEAVRRTLGIRMHEVQLAAGWAMSEGHIAEMMTGEGKTVASLLPVYWYALAGKGVHVVTANEYLARRDSEQASDVFRLLGMTVGMNGAELDIRAKQQAYGQHITYGTATEFGFDYLRDHLILHERERVQRNLAYALVDEIDGILIDEARTPLIIAGKAKAAPDLYYICSKFARSLATRRDYEMDVETKQVMFTEAGIRKIEASFHIDNLYELEQTTVYHYLLQSLRAEALMRRDVDYIVTEGAIRLIDAFTGRVLEGRQFSEGLQQAIEAKEGVPLSEENRVHATITVQKYFSLYKQMAGMTGTIRTEADEMKLIYGLDVVTVPTHAPVIRRDLDDVWFLTSEAKYEHAVQEVQRRHANGQPVLVGTASVRQSEEMASRLERIGLPFRLLNAKTMEEEAAIISAAGQRGAITIATNMAGRGTDIRLGEGVAELGGLFVLATERHESRRIDRQLRGRAGRQGDPGETQFYISLEDDLPEQYAAEDAKAMRRLWRGGDGGSRTDGRMTHWLEGVQQNAERQNFALRSFVYQLDSIIHEQRESFYWQRNALLCENGAEAALLDMLRAYGEDVTRRCCPSHRQPEEWRVDKLFRTLGIGPDAYEAERMSDHHEVMEWTIGAVNQRWSVWRSGKSFNGDLETMRRLCLNAMDRHWMKHLEQLQHLRQGIHYQSYAGRDPIHVYKDEAWRMFQKASDRILQEIGRLLLHRIEVAGERESHILQTG